MSAKSSEISEIPEIPVISSINDIEFLTLQGGGMKGIGFIGAVEELEKTGVLAQIKEVAGSSAGGLMATLLAIGCTAEDIRKLMLKLDFKSFQDKSEIGWVESTHLKDVLKGGVDFAGSVLEKVNILKNIPIIGNVIDGHVKPYTAYLQTATDMGSKVVSALGYAETGEEIAGLVFGKELGLYKGEALTYWLADIINQKTGNPNITFRQLAELTKLGGGSQYKKLTLTGSNLTDKKLTYFNAETYPDMPIIQAARISASFPGAYKPVITVEERNGKDVNVVWVDGGLLENLPDVFNKKPYVVNEGKGNPKALALSFKAPSKDELKEIGTLPSFAQALYETKTTENPLLEKYGERVVYINTLGMGTLEFDAPDKKREDLAVSGSTAVKEVFSTILSNEENKRKKNKFYYRDFSDEELIRITTELTIKYTKNPEEANEEYGGYLLELDERKIPEAKLQKLKEKAEKSYYRKQKLLDPDMLSDEELSNLCAHKISEREELENQLEEKVDKLKYVKTALVLYGSEIQEEFKNNKEFRAHLAELHSINARIRDERKDKELHPVNREAKKKKDFEEKIQREAKDDFDKLLKERQEFYEKTILKYKDSNYPVSYFFKNLREENNKNPGLKIPITKSDFPEYFSNEIDKWEKLIHEAEGEIKKNKHQLSSFRQYHVAFSEKNPKSKHFSALLNLEIELDASIRQKTTLVTKINNFLMQKVPKLRIIITPTLQTVAFLSFICTLPIAIPAVPVALAVRKFNKKAEARETAGKVINFFRLSYVDRDVKLRELQEVTSNFIEVIRKNQGRADVEEATYLSKLHAFYLKDSGLSLKDVFAKKQGESLEKYQERIEEIRRKLEELSPESKEFDLSQASKNSENFRRDVVGNAKRSEKIEIETEIKQRNFRSIDLEFLKKMDKEMFAGKKLTKDEVISYVKSSKEIERELPKAFEKKYKSILDEIETEQDASREFLRKMNYKMKKEKLTSGEVNLYIVNANKIGRRISKTFEDTYKDVLDKIETVRERLQELDRKMLKEKLTKEEVILYVRCANTIEKPLSYFFKKDHKAILKEIEENPDLLEPRKRPKKNI